MHFFLKIYASFYLFIYCHLNCDLQKFYKSDPYVLINDLSGTFLFTL